MDDERAIVKSTRSVPLPSAPCLDDVAGRRLPAMAMVPYVVRGGEYLRQIAFRMGFDPDAVWNADENSDLRTARGDHNILAPGDILYVPETTPKWFSVNVGAVNKFVASPPTVTISIRLAIDGQACASEAYTIEGDATPASGTTGGDGLLKFTVPVTTRAVIVELPDRNIQFPVGVGDLDPITTDSGAAQRLAHLGYLEEGAGDDPSALIGALTLFQAAQGLPVTGMMDDPTRSALTSAHGS